MSVGKGRSNRPRSTKRAGSKPTFKVREPSNVLDSVLVDPEFDQIDIEDYIAGTYVKSEDQD